MMQNLDDWANGRRPQDLLTRCADQKLSSEARKIPLQAIDRAIDLDCFMGRWYVVLNIPTYFDRDTVNNVEEYSYDESTETIEVSFTYCDKRMSKRSELKQRAKVVNDRKTQWSLKPKIGVYLPLQIPYLIADCGEDYSSTIIGVPDRSYIWVMTRTPNPDPSLIEALTKKVQLLGYDVNKLVACPQRWEGESPQLVEPEP